MSDFHSIDMDITYESVFDDYTDGSESENETERMYIADAFIRCRRRFHVVDIGYIAHLSDTTPKKVIEALGGKAIFQDPAYFTMRLEWKEDEGWIFREQYLSGFLPEKLKAAEQMERRFPGRFGENIRTLKKLIEKDGPSAGQMEITLGSPFVPCDIYASFIQFLLRLRVKPMVKFNAVRRLFEVQVAAKDDMDTIRRNPLYSTGRMSALDIIIKTMNAVTLKIYDEQTDYAGKVVRVFNKTYTYRVQEIQKKIIKEFRDYIAASSVRQTRIRDAFARRFIGFYNEPYDGSYLDFPDLNPDIVLYPHQKSSIARILESEQNVLLAHHVGAGKTHIIVASAHELYRTRLSRKNLIVVPNNILQDFEKVHRQLYPNDDILIISPRKFTPSRRAQALEEIRDGDHVAVYMAYSSFDMIRMSKMYKLNQMSQEVARLRAAAANAPTKTEGATYQHMADKISRKMYDFTLNYEDAPWLCFDHLGIETLYLDEAHNYKNISIKSRSDNIVGMRAKGSMRADEALEKVHSVNRAIFSTGTPLCNSLADLYTLMKFLQPEQLRFRQIDTFDLWINTFGERTSDFELDVAHKLRAVTRFSSFHNLSELMGMFSMVCDFCYDIDRDIPVRAYYEDVKLSILNEQAEYISDLGHRTDLIARHKVPRTEDNLLKVTTDGRKCALDPRLVGLSGDFDNCKVNACADKIIELYRRFPDKAQVVFSDLGTPKAGFNVYDTLRYRLVQSGIPWDEIAFVHSANSEQKRLKLFKAVNEGRVRVILGSTEKLGVGVNIQKRLIALHHLSVPWRPADIEQREGRILRRGNECGKVYIFRYITEGTFDGYSWQKLESKQKFIASFLAGASSASKVDDIADTVLSYAEIKALAIGNPLIKKRVETANMIEHTRISSRQRIKELSDLKEIIDHQPERMIRQKELIRVTQADAEYYQQNRSRISQEERKAFGEELILALLSNAEKNEAKIFDEYQGFKVELPRLMEHDKPFVNLIGPNGGRYYTAMDYDKPMGCSQRLDILLDRLGQRAQEQTERLSQMRRQLKDARADYARGNPYPDRVEELERELAEIDQKLEESEAA